MDHVGTTVFYWPVYSYAYFGWSEVRYQFLQSGLK